jgi:DNA-binding NtrC family response regulator
MLVHVLVISNDAGWRRRLGLALAPLPEVCVTADTPDHLWEHLNRGDVDLLLIDQAGLSRKPSSVVGTIRQLPEQPEVVAITRQEDAAVRADLLAAGCMAVLNASLDETRLRETLAALAERRRNELTHELGSYREMERASLSDFVSESPTMQRFTALARRVVQADSSLLLLGETGVGKERLASAIHHDGPRRASPFLCINCAALPETLLESELFGHELGAFTGATRAHRGYFERAHGGTVFLDEIAEMPLHLQVKLLRVLESRTVQRLGSETSHRVDVRLMAATNRDLEAEVSAGRFRPDLYYRLAVVNLHLPPLRERREDIPGLVGSYLEHFGVALGGQPRTITPRALEALIRYDWPGNVRELINIIERTTLLTASSSIDLQDLPEEITRSAMARGGNGRAMSHPEMPAASWDGLSLAEARARVLADFHGTYLRSLLTEHRGRIGDSAKAAGINVRTLYQLMKKYGLRKEDYRAVAPNGDGSAG